MLWNTGVRVGYLEYAILIFVYFILAMADYYTTYIILTVGHGKELNPIANVILKSWGYEGLLFSQVLSWALLLFSYPLLGTEAYTAASVILLIKALVVLNNIMNVILMVSR